MKKFISILLSLLLILNTLTTVFAVGTAITLQVDSNTINIGSRSVTIDTAPVIIDGRTLIPVRGVSEAMGGNVDWNNDTKTVTITLGSNKVEMTVDSKTAYFNNNAQTLDVAPVILNGRTMLPARFIAESFGFDVLSTLDSFLDAYPVPVTHPGPWIDIQKDMEQQTAVLEYRP